jgi:hypothetical protein
MLWKTKWKNHDEIKLKKTNFFIKSNGKNIEIKSNQCIICQNELKFLFIKAVLK